MCRGNNRYRDGVAKLMQCNPLYKVLWMDCDRSCDIIAFLMCVHFYRLCHAYLCSIFILFDPLAHEPR